MFKLGDQVEWRSQAAGSWKVKSGAVVQVVPAGQTPCRVMFPQLHKHAGVGAPRDHESYVVKVGWKVYWPRANKLHQFIE